MGMNKKIFIVASVIEVICTIVVIIAFFNAMNNGIKYLPELQGWGIMTVAWLIVAFACRNKQPKIETPVLERELTEEEKKKQWQKAEGKRVADEFLQKRQEKHELATTIVRTAIIDDSASSYKTKKSTTSAVGRAVVGGAIAGPVGSIVGASTAKGSVQEIKGKKVRFLIEYANGKKKTEDVKIDSRRYKELIQYM